MASVELSLEAAPHRAVYRELVKWVRSDPVLARVIRGWRVWDRHPDAARPLAPTELPGLRLTPSEGPDQFHGPSGLIGPLHVRVEVATFGSDTDDPLDLYHAVRRAVYPRDEARKLALHQALVAAGAEAMYTVQFSQGSFAPVVDGDGVIFVATGQLKVNVRADVI